MTVLNDDLILGNVDQGSKSQIYSLVVMLFWLLIYCRFSNHWPIHEVPLWGLEMGIIYSKLIISPSYKYHKQHPVWEFCKSYVKVMCILMNCWGWTIFLCSQHDAKVKLSLCLSIIPWRWVVSFMLQILYCGWKNPLEPAK